MTGIRSVPLSLKIFTIATEPFSIFCHFLYLVILLFSQKYSYLQIYKVLTLILMKNIDMPNAEDFQALSPTKIRSLQNV